MRVSEGTVDRPGDDEEEERTEAGQQTRTVLISIPHCRSRSLHHPIIPSLSPSKSSSTSRRSRTDALVDPVFNSIVNDRKTSSCNLTLRASVSVHIHGSKSVTRDSHLASRW